MERGFAAVNHRAVAERARLPLAATTYYFSSLVDLLAQTVEALAQRWVDGVRDAVADLPREFPDVRALATAVVHVVAAAPTRTPGPDPASLLTMYDRYLEAGRHAGMQAVIARYDRQVDAALADLLGRVGLDTATATVRLVLAVTDGALLRALGEGADPGPAAIDAVQQLLGLLAVRPA